MKIQFNFSCPQYFSGPQLKLNAPQMDMLSFPVFESTVYKMFSGDILTVDV